MTVDALKSWARSPVQQSDDYWMAAIRPQPVRGADPKAGRWAAATWYSNGGGSFGTTGDITDSDSLIDPTFSVQLRFRPGRSAHQAVRAKRRTWPRAGGGYRPGEVLRPVNHDILMASRHVADKRLLRRLLEAGMMTEDVRPSRRGNAARRSTASFGKPAAG
jgi:hypothetical protein